jgi:hypothetical protein
LIDTGFEHSYTLRILGLECGDLGSQCCDVVRRLNGGRGHHGGNSHGPNESRKVSHRLILVERRLTGREAAGVIERIDRSARRSAGEKSAARGAQHRGFETTGSQRAGDLESQEEYDRGTADHGQQRRVRDAFLAEAGAFPGRELLVGPAGGMTQFMQQRRRLRKEERNQCKADEPVTTGRTQDDALLAKTGDTSGKR